MLEKQIELTAVPAKYFAIGPYRAEQIGPRSGWWAVMNASGLNVLTFSDHPGVVITNEPTAKKIADNWNNDARKTD